MNKRLLTFLLLLYTMFTISTKNVFLTIDAIKLVLTLSAFVALLTKISFGEIIIKTWLIAVFIGTSLILLGQLAYLFSNLEKVNLWLSTELTVLLVVVGYILFSEKVNQSPRAQ